MQIIVNYFLIKQPLTLIHPVLEKKGGDKIKALVELKSALICLCT